MPRYERSYTGEKRTDGLRLALTPSERAELEDATKGQTVSMTAAPALTHTA